MIEDSSEVEFQVTASCKPEFLKNDFANSFLIVGGKKSKKITSLLGFSIYLISSLDFEIIMEERGYPVNVEN